MSERLSEDKRAETETSTKTISMGQNEQDCDIYVSRTQWLSCDQGIQEVGYRKDISLKVKQRENQNLGEILQTT